MSDIKSELESLELTHSGVIFGHLWSSLVDFNFRAVIVFEFEMNSEEA